MNTRKQPDYSDIELYLGLIWVEKLGSKKYLRPRFIKNSYYDDWPEKYDLVMNLLVLAAQAPFNSNHDRDYLITFIDKSMHIDKSYTHANELPYIRVLSLIQVEVIRLICSDAEIDFREYLKIVLEKLRSTKLYIKNKFTLSRIMQKHGKTNNVL